MTSQPVLSVCLPTFNRRDLLVKVLDSFHADPAFKQIELVIVDDGSTDGTSEWLQGQGFGTDPLRILAVQENAGKIRALSNGLQLATGQYSMIWDSDDLLVEGALTFIIDYLRSLENLPLGPRPVCGFVGLAISPDGDVIGDAFPEDKNVSNLLAILADLKVDGDKKEVVLTEALRESLRNLPAGQRDFPTSLLWDRIAREYDILTVNHPLVIKVYLPGGITSRQEIIKQQSAAGTFLREKERIESYKLGHYNSILFLARSYAKAWRYTFHARSPRNILFLLRMHPLWALLTWPVGFAFYLRDRVV